MRSVIFNRPNEWIVGPLFSHRTLLTFAIFCSTVTQFILEQQELKLKKNSKSRKKRKQNTEEEDGKIIFHLLSSKTKIIQNPKLSPEGH